MKKLTLVFGTLLTFTSIFFAGNQLSRSGSSLGLNSLMSLNIANAEGGGSHTCYKYTAGNRSVYYYDCKDCVQKRGDSTLTGKSSC